MNIFNENEFLQICERFHVKPFAKDIAINYHTNSYFNRVKRFIEEDRRGEIVFCVIRPNGKAILVTCSKYPKGIFRVPTGGINHHEDIVDALDREVNEELGIETEVIKFIGVLKLKFQYKDDNEMFYSYLFILKEKGGRLLEDASDNEISEIKEVDLKAFQACLETLKNINERWEDWGCFRYETSCAIFNYLKKNYKELGIEGL